MKKIHKLNSINVIPMKTRIIKVSKYFILLAILPFFIFLNTYSDDAPTMDSNQ
jgi:hypothetical protein